MDNKLLQFLKENINNIPLSERERLILEYRFGLRTNITHTLEETGRVFGVTRERIRQIEIKILEKLNWGVRNQ